MGTFLSSCDFPLGIPPVWMWDLFCLPLSMWDLFCLPLSSFSVEKLRSDVFMNHFCLFVSEWIIDYCNWTNGFCSIFFLICTWYFRFINHGNEREKENNMSNIMNSIDYRNLNWIDINIIENVILLILYTFDVSFLHFDSIGNYKKITFSLTFSLHQ